MNDHLKVLRSLTPCFYIKRVYFNLTYPYIFFFLIIHLHNLSACLDSLLKIMVKLKLCRVDHRNNYLLFSNIISSLVHDQFKHVICVYLICLLNFFFKGDQASIIGGVIEFIKELHQVLQALESQKRRKSLSPSPGPSPRTTLQPAVFHQLDSSSMTETNAFKELGASCNSSVADVEVKISGSNVILKVISHRIPGQVAKIIAVLESLSFEVLHLNISSMEETVLYQFVVKVKRITLFFW